MKTETVDLNTLWRKKFTERIGGGNFDALGGGYSFQVVVDEERQREKANVPGRPETALLKLSVADPTWRMPAGAMEAAMEYFIKAWDATRYKDTAGVFKTPGTIMTANTHEMIAQAIQARHSVVTENGQGLTADWVQYSPGSIKRALAECIPTLLFEDGVRLLFPTPSYQVIASSMNRGSAELIEVPLVNIKRSGWQFDLPELTKIAEAGNQYGLRSVMYVNIPHNPTGFGYTRADWEILIRWATEHNVTLIVDEAYIDLRYRQDIVSVLQVPGWERCCIVLQSVSKGWNATGLRFGYIIAHPTVIKALRKLMDVKDSGLFGPSIVAGIWCLLHPEVAEETKAKYRGLHQALASGLEQAGFAGGMPDAGLCQFTPAPKEVIFNEACLSDGSHGTGNVFFKDAAECAKWFRENLRVSVMHAQAAGRQWLRWAVTIKPVPECGLETEEAVIAETVRRLKSVKFVF